MASLCFRFSRQPSYLVLLNFWFFSLFQFLYWWKTVLILCSVSDSTQGFSDCYVSRCFSFSDQDCYTSLYLSNKSTVFNFCDKILLDVLQRFTLQTLFGFTSVLLILISILNSACWLSFSSEALTWISPHLDFSLLIIAL